MGGYKKKKNVWLKRKEKSFQSFRMNFCKLKEACLLCFSPSSSRNNKTFYFYINLSTS